MSVIIRLQKLPLTANASDVRSFFRGLSIPDGGVHIVGGEMGDAFIAFSTDEDARQAMALNGGSINGEPILLLLSSRAEMQKIIDQARKAALDYMQMSRVAARPKVAPSETTVKPSPMTGIGAMSAQLAQFGSLPALAGNAIVGNVSTSALKQQPQPPVISLAGFLAKTQSASMGNTSPLTKATVAVPTAAAQSAAAYGALLTQGSAYNEIPGLSFLSPSAVSNNGTLEVASAANAVASGLNASDLTGWLSALNGQLLNKASNAPLHGAAGVDHIDTSFLANSVSQSNVKGMQRETNNQSQWKFLKKDRRSRTPSRERGHKRVGRSRSSSRDREHKRDRRSRSSSRERSSKRNGRRSRSSSRDRGSRSWSRGSSRDYDRRYRNSRSPSRDRFGRTRHRSRTRSPRNHRSRDSSRDRSREPSGGRYDRDNRQGQNRGRFSHFSGRQQNLPENVPPQSPWSTLGKMFAQEVEPIFGLHTMSGSLSQDSRSRPSAGGSQGSVNFLPTRSGKISPPPMSNGVSTGGGHFRNTSPLPESVYSGVTTSTTTKNDDETTSDYAIKLSNLESVTGYGELRRFFKTLLISTQGIKMINDQNGRRTGVAYIQFLRKDGKRMAMLRDGAVIRRTRVRIESVTDQEFEQAIDSYRPGSDKSGYQQPYQQNTTQQNLQPWSTDSGNNAPWSSNSVSRGDGPWDGPNGGSNLLATNDTFDGTEDPKSIGYAPTSALMVWNLPTFTTEQDIMKIFSDFTVVEVLIVKNHIMPKQLDGYVRFHRQDDAKEAWGQVHRHYIGNKKVTVRMCPEIDYAVAKNEYENPSDAAVPDAAEVVRVSEETGFSDGGNSQDINHNLDEPRHGGPSVPCNDQDGTDRNNEGERQQHRQRATDCDKRDKGVTVSDGGGGQEQRSGGARKKRWDTEKNWDEEDDRSTPSMAPQRPMMDSDAGACSDTNASWVDHDQRMNRGDDRGRNSQENESNRYNNEDGRGNNNNSGTSTRDPRRQQSSAGGRGSSGRGNSVDNSELFQRTTCLLLRNVDYNIYEEDVFHFFAQDGFRARNVLLVRNERGKRTGECLVEFESPCEAAHAESKSSKTLGRRKVFASHLDRFQVAELMKRFDAIAEGRRSPNLHMDGRRGMDDDQHDDPEENQGIGCGPYRTSTVGLLNLAYKTTVEDVQKFFREFDLPVENVRRRFLDNGQSTGEAMVRFRHHMDAEKALNEYQNRKLFGRNVRIRLINDD